MIRIAFPDGSTRAVPVGTRIHDIVDAAAPPLEGMLSCVTIDGDPRDVHDRLTSDGTIAFHTAETPEGRWVLCHTAAHVAAQAVRRLFPHAVLGIGKASEDGFRQDVQICRPFTEADLASIEAEMIRIVDEDLPVERYEMSKGDARTLLIRLGEVLKVELLEEIDAPFVTLYRQGDHIDLCRGPHAPSTGSVPPVRLSDLGMVLWRHDPHAEGLARLRGTVLPPG